MKDGLSLEVWQEKTVRFSFFLTRGRAILKFLTVPFSSILRSRASSPTSGSVGSTDHDEYLQSFPARGCTRHLRGPAHRLGLGGGAQCGHQSDGRQPPRLDRRLRQLRSIQRPVGPSSPRLWLSLGGAGRLIP